MAKLFNCINCNNEIFTKYVKVGEEAKCKVCGSITKVPVDAKDVNELDYKPKPIIDSVSNTSQTKQAPVYKKKDSNSKNTGLHVNIEDMFGEPIMKIDGGVTETLYLYKNKIIIAPRKTLLGKIEGGGHEIIYLKHIKDIEFKYGGTLLNGYIQFRTSSSGNTKKSGILPGLETSNDPNTVHFSKKANDKMFEILKIVDEHIGNQD